MMKHYDNSSSLSQKILNGVNKLADNVGSTLGPRGKNVILFDRKQGVPVVTKDGVTVAKFVELEDHFENIGAQIVKQASEKSAENAGDGTTTATVLARAMLVEAQKYVAAGVSPTEVKRGMDKACGWVVAELKEQSLPIKSVEDIRNIATISANNDKTIGNLIATAVDSTGKDGSIIVEEANSNETTLNLIEGFRFNTGYAANAFINNERTRTVEYDNPLVFITDEKIEAVDQIIKVLELVARENRPLIMVANDFEGQALAALIMNATRGTMKVCAVKAPLYGEERRKIMKDLCLSTGATYMTRANALQLKDVKLGHFGQAKKVSITKTWTTVVGGKGDQKQIDKQIQALKTEIQQTESLKECERIQERITRLASGVAVIRVGAPTEVEMIEKKHRIDDALEAVRSAQEEGIVSGGGTALLRAAFPLSHTIGKELTEEQSIGAKIVLAACEAPIRQMAANAGESPDLIVREVKNSSVGMGWDFLNRETKDLIESGIIDPVKVTRCALQNATSVAGTLINTNYAIVS